MKFFYVMLGGSFGALFRYLAGIILKKQFTHSFLTGSLLINIIGSFLLAFLLQANNMDNNIKIALTTGFMGAFTTYSTFSYEILNHYSQNSVYHALIYSFLMLTLSFLATLLGFYAGKSIFL